MRIVLICERSRIICFPFSFYIRTAEFQKREGRQLIDEEIVINKNQEYQKLLGFRRSTEENYEDIKKDNSRRLCYAIKECETMSLPPIDFSQKTLLAKYARSSCAATRFNKKVVRDDRNKTYTYSVDIKNRLFMRCNGPGLASMNWITFPKIPEYYTVNFRPKPAQGRYYVPDSKGGWIDKDTEGNIIRTIDGRTELTDEEKKFLEEQGIRSVEVQR